LRTSVLDRVNGELAGLLTGRPGSEPILLDLEDANAFVESLDPMGAAPSRSGTDTPDGSGRHGERW